MAEDIPSERQSYGEDHKSLVESTERRGEHIEVSQVGTAVSSVDEDNPLFIRDLAYSREEEARVIRILDMRLFPWILLTTFVLNMDRTNNSNAISDNLPADLGFSINVVNTATAIYSVLFSIACLSGAVIAKYAGPSRCEII